MVTAAQGPIVNPENLEINAVEHCNLTCAGCSHLSPVMPKRAAEPAVVHRDLKALEEVYRAAAVKVVGGEPLLHPDLPGLLEAVRATNVAPRIAICSNGLLLDRMDPAVWRLIDDLEVSCYPGTRFDRIDTAAVRSAARTHDVELRWFRYSTFRIPYLESDALDPKTAQRVFRACQVAHHWRCHTISDGRFYRCPQALFLGKHFGEAADGDGVDLHAPDLAERLTALLETETFLPACRRCLGTCGRILPHRQAGRRDWSGDQTGTSADLLDHERLAALEQDVTLDEVGDSVEWNPAASA